MRKRVRIPPLQELPSWYQPEAPLGSAVRHVASLSPKFAGVTASVRAGSRKGASIGEPGPARSRWKVQIPNVGRFEIHCLEAPSEEEKTEVAQVAAELGNLWSA